jgi:hypothetical protein
LRTGAGLAPAGLVVVGGVVVVATVDLVSGSFVVVGEIGFVSVGVVGVVGFVSRGVVSAGTVGLVGVVSAAGTVGFVGLVSAVAGVVDGVEVVDGGPEDTGAVVLGGPLVATVMDCALIGFAPEVEGFVDCAMLGSEALISTTGGGPKISGKTNKPQFAVCADAAVQTRNGVRHSASVQRLVQKSTLSQARTFNANGRNAISKINLAPASGETAGFHRILAVGVMVRSAIVPIASRPAEAIKIEIPP